MDSTRRNDARIAQRVCAAIENDPASSVRHWTEVLNAAEVRMNDSGWSERSRKRAEAEYLRALRALARLAAGEQVSL